MLKFHKILEKYKKIYMLAYSDSTYNAVNRNSGGHLQRIF